MDPLPAREYHDRTKHSPAALRESDFELDFGNRPRPYEIYEGLPAVELPDDPPDPERPALRAIADAAPAADPSATRPDARALAALCELSAGITRTIRRGGREHAFRAAACTGALYHVDLYPVVGDVPGLDPAVYHYDPRTDALDVLREGDFRGVLATASGHDAVAEAPVTVVTTSTWWRNAWKYRERTYRHAFWDSGTILANLLAVAAALDLPADVVLGFADRRVADLLGVDPAREAPLELVPIGGGDPAPEPPAVEPIDPSTRPLSEEERTYDAIEAAYAASSLPDGEAASAWRTTGSPPADGADARGADAAAGDDPGLPDPVGDDRAAKTPLGRTIRRRGSCREYAREPLNGRKVSTVLDRAVRGGPLDARDPDGPRLQFNDLYLIVNAVEGVPPGAYRHRPDAGTLEPVRTGEFRAEAGHLALDQRLAADAALCAFFLTDLDAVVDRLGDRGYRAAQLEAALAAGRLYLGAYAHRDLGATGLTFYDDEVTDFFGPRAADRTPTFCWTLGRPA